ncbi:MAG: sugar ABC transporter ATP-binding protein [Spirochaetales bacterium]|nr:sugar ABC transporter ATP-binding protein [Spirochaetales bacterium]MCF7937892.1 sugar ABC transporter ATP-binding protein [Spirochaetales bacterium]
MELNSKLEAVGLTKKYPGTIALKDFSAVFDGGKVNAVIGKNGAGKSTLMKIFSGAIQPSEGKIKINGEPIIIHDPSDAFQKGIGMVYQELSLIPELSVTENIFLGRLPKKDLFGKSVIDWKLAYKKTKEILTSMEIEIDVKVPVRKLSVGQQQLVEIAKAMSFSPSVLILDEPTSALAKHETQMLFSIISNLKKHGVAIIYITHRLQELNEIADTVTVIRDGFFVGTENMEDVTPAKIVDMMFGEVEQRTRPEDLGVSEEIILEVKNLTRRPEFEDISFRLKRGEVLGIAGMLGSGRSELLRAIFGADPYQSGEILFEGESLPGPYHNSPALCRDLGIAMTPENRKTEGLILPLSVRQNLCLASMNQIAANGIITITLERKYAEKQAHALQIKYSNLEEHVSSLSGGNQQKVVIGNWLNTDPKVIIFDEPSRGIDVQAKQQIFQIMWDLSRKNLSSIFVSTELEELLEVCHRILVMRHGRIIQEVFPDNTSLEQLYAMCMEA